MAICLSLKTGLASPQFHYKVDTTFSTLKTAFKQHLPESLWQSKCHFKKAKVPSPTDRTRAAQPADSPDVLEAADVNPQVQVQLPAYDPDPELPDENIQVQPPPEPAPEVPRIPQWFNPDEPADPNLRRTTRQRRPTPRLAQAQAYAATVPFETL